MNSGVSRISFRGATKFAFARGFGGMLPRENFKKWCTLVRFGEYFANILYKKKW